MSDEEDQEGCRAFYFDGFPSFDVRDARLSSTVEENTRLKKDLDRMSRQLDRLISLGERERSGRAEKTSVIQRQMKPVPIFSGKDSNINVNDWVREVDYTIRTSQLDDDEALDLLERYVAGQAAKVFRGEVDKGKRYPEILKRLQVIFGEHVGRDPLQIFYCRTQRDAENPAEFAIELAELLGIAEKKGNGGRHYPNRDKMLTDALMGGLRDENTVMQLRPLAAMDVPFETIQDELLKLECDRKRVNNRFKGDTNGSYSSLLKAMGEFKTELKEELKKLDNKIERQGKS